MSLKNLQTWTGYFREYYEQFHNHKFDNLSEIDELIKTQKLPKSPSIK